MLKELISGKRRLATAVPAVFAVEEEAGKGRTAGTATTAVAESQENHAFHPGDGHAQEAKKEIPPETGSGPTILTEPRVEPSPMTNARPVATDDAIFLYRHAVNLICRIAEDSPAYARLVAAFDAGDGFGFDDDLGETFLACLALCDAETRGDFSDYAELLEERLAIRAESRPGTSNNVKPSMAA